MPVTLWRRGTSERKAIFVNTQHSDHYVTALTRPHSRRSLFAFTTGGLALVAIPGTEAEAKRKRKKKGKKSRSGQDWTPPPSDGAAEEEEAVVPTGPVVTACATAKAVEMLGLVNAWRAQHGVGPMALDGILQASGQTKVAMMVSTGIFNHVINGVTPDQNLINHGYPEDLCAGENIYANPLSTTDNVLKPFGFWKSSPSHNAAMLDPLRTALGLLALRAKTC